MTRAAAPHALGVPARFFLAAAVAVGLLVGFTTTASATTVPAAQNAVGASTVAVATHVGPSANISPAMSRDSYDSQAITASATGVAANTETTSLFRAVGPDEAADIANTGGLRISGNSTGGKYFWDTPEGANGFLNSTVMKGDGAVVGVRVPSAIVNDATATWSNLDGLGGARYYEGSQWTNFQNAVEGIFNVG
jgi:hypothetical protein